MLRVNTYAELYGNIKKGPIKNGPGNKMIAAKALANSPVYGAVKQFTEEGDAMDRFLENHKSPLANQELYETANRVATAFNDSTYGMIMPSL